MFLLRHIHVYENVAERCNTAKMMSFYSRYLCFNFWYNIIKKRTIREEISVVLSRNSYPKICSTCMYTFKKIDTDAQTNDQSRICQD